MKYLYRFLIDMLITLYLFLQFAFMVAGWRLYFLPMAQELTTGKLHTLFAEHAIFNTLGCVFVVCSTFFTGALIIRAKFTMDDLRKTRPIRRS